MSHTRVGTGAAEEPGMRRDQGPTRRGQGGTTSSPVQRAAEPCTANSRSGVQIRAGSRPRRESRSARQVRGGRSGGVRHGCARACGCRIRSSVWFCVTRHARHGVRAACGRRQPQGDGRPAACTAPSTATAEASTHTRRADGRTGTTWFRTVSSSAEGACVPRARVTHRIAASVVRKEGNERASAFRRTLQAARARRNKSARQNFSLPVVEREEGRIAQGFGTTTRQQSSSRPPTSHLWRPVSSERPLPAAARPWLRSASRAAWSSPPASASSCA